MSLTDNYVDRQCTTLCNNISFVFIYRTEDSFQEEDQERQAQEQGSSSGEDPIDDPVTDRDYVPPQRRSSDEFLDPSEVPIMVEEEEEEQDVQVVGPSQPAGEDELPAAQPPRPTTHATPTSRRGRGTDTTTTSARSRVPPGPPPTRRETEAEMSGAVSGLLGILQSHQAIVTRQLEDGDRVQLIDQYRKHIDSLQSQMKELHEHYQSEQKLVHEHYRAQFDQLQIEHRQAIGQMQQVMQQMHQNIKALKVQSHPCYHMAMSLLPYLENVPRQNMMACHTNIIDVIKNHVDPTVVTQAPFRPSQTTVQPWHSASQSYLGYRGMPYTPLFSGSSTSTASTQDSPDVTASASLFISSGAEPNV